MSSSYWLIKGVIAIIVGLPIVLRPSLITERVQQRMKEGDDRYFEEQRSYQTYRLWEKPGRIRIVAIGLTCLGCHSLLRGLQIF